ncbi:hypothetical protein HBB16_05380 [Pseudonocardia sp. MCCB 268]|nr:hypothetical protein [Pseudonocardia cytotoxica]
MLKEEGADMGVRASSLAPAVPAAERGGRSPRCCRFPFCKCLFNLSNT